MKKIIKSLVATGALLTFSAVPVFGATQSCTISNGNGANSTNECQFDNSSHIIYRCTNSVLVVNGTNQTSSSGVAQTTGNTSVGNVSSGSAVNDGEVTTNVDATCNPPAQTVTTPPTTTTPAGGAGAVAAATTTKAAALPATGENSVLKTASILAAVTGATAVVIQLGLASYRRFALKK